MFAGTFSRNKLPHPDIHSHLLDLTNDICVPMEQELKVTIHAWVLKLLEQRLPEEARQGSKSLGLINRAWPLKRRCGNSNYCGQWWHICCPLWRRNHQVIVTVSRFKSQDINRRYMDSVKNHDIVFGIGASRNRKTFLAVTLAKQLSNEARSSGSS